MGGPCDTGCFLGQLQVSGQVLSCVRPVDTDYQEIMARGNAPRWIRMMKDYGIERPAAGQAATQPA